MKPLKRMATMRSDVERDRQLTNVPNSSYIGFSSGKLRYGDFFVVRDGDCQWLCRCHGRIRPNGNTRPGELKYWRILAQAAPTHMGWTGERWIDPEDVFETIPAERMDPNIVKFFEEHCTAEEGSK